VQAQTTLQQRLSHLPFRLLIVAAVLVIIALIVSPIVGGMSDKDKASNVLLTGVPFILTIVAIVLTFIFLIFVAAAVLSGNVSPKVYTIVEWFIIACVVLGVVGMFQPWNLIGYQVGFLLLFFALLAFNVWSHITPKRTRRGETNSIEQAKGSH